MQGTAAAGLTWAGQGTAGQGSGDRPGTGPVSRSLLWPGPEHDPAGFDE